MSSSHQSSLNGLEPKIIWNLFSEISKIPRRSKHEGKIRSWVKKWAEKNHQIEFKEDSVGNLLLYGKATAGCEEFPGVILQGHLDMVAQKESNSNHNFDTDPIPILVEKNFVKADKTTLGADNGIGVSMALAALIDPTLKHGPLEVLLTVDEETGLTGAFGLEPGFFSHKLLFNLDSEDEGEITISSAGGGDTKITLPLQRKAIDGYRGFNIYVKGLIGGHSGVDIHLPRKNAIQLLVEGFENLGKGIHIILSYISGGTAHNAIPRDASAEILVPNAEVATFQLNHENWKKTLESYKSEEPSLKVLITETQIQEGIENSSEVMKLLKKLPHGVVSYSKSIPDLVETSNNFAVITTASDSIEIKISTRSSVDSELDRVRQDIRAIAESVNASVSQGPAYPGWEPDLESDFLHLVHKVYEKEFRNKVELKAIHAGLETGLFKGIDPELHCVSIGPEIKDPHSPSERVSISSVEMIWRVVKSVLTEINSLK
jgi:dipeptidase D